MSTNVTNDTGAGGIPGGTGNDMAEVPPETQDEFEQRLNEDGNADTTAAGDEQALEDQQRFEEAMMSSFVQMSLMMTDSLLDSIEDKSA